MSLISKKPSAPPDVKPVIPGIASVEAKTNVVDTTRTSLADLSVFSQGYSYIVNYYSSVLGRDNATYGLDSNKSNIEQQYRKINRLEIKLQESLRTVQDSETKRMTVEGSGLIVAGLIPNEGDMFVADAGDGREGVFQVSNTEQLSIYSESVYRVDFKMMFFSYESPTRRAELEAKVVELLHYVRDYARYGRDPIIGDKTYNAVIRLQGLKRNMMDDYLSWFTSRDRATILVPGQLLATSDPYLTSAIHKIVSVSNFPDLARVRELNMDDHNLHSEPTVWDALIKRRKDLIRSVRQKATCCRVQQFSARAMFQSARYSGIEVLVYPTGGRKAIDDFLNKMEVSAFGLALENNLGVGASSTEMSQDTKPLLVNDQMVGIKEVTADDFYVFSDAFYQPDASKPLSLLEKLAYDFLQGEALDATHLLWLADSYTLWGDLERFYYVPVLIILIQSLIQEA